MLGPDPRELSSMSTEKHPQAISILSELLRSSSGIEMRDLDPNSTFLELGFDSLFLIQFSQKIKQKTGVKITFRQLIESIPNIGSLIDYVAGEMRSDQTNDNALTNDHTVAAIDSSALPPTTPIDLPSSLSASIASVPPSAIPAGFAASSIPSSSSLTHPLPPLTSVPFATNSAKLQGLEQIIAQQNQLMILQLQVLQAAAGQRVHSAPNVDISPTPVNAAETDKQENPELRTVAAVANQGLAAVPESYPTVSQQRSVLQNPSKEQEKKAFERFGPYKPIRKSTSGGLTESQQKHLTQLIERFTKKTRKSREHAQKYRDVFADPRGVAGYRSIWKSMVYQIAVARSSGSKLWDIDGNEYIDIAMGFGLNLFGQSPDFVTEALRAQLERGVEVGPQSPLAGEVAKLLCHFSGMDRATFCNTGSEAVMAAMRIARTVTGKALCVFFNKDYHGNFDEVLLRSAVVGGKRRTSPAAPGVPQVLADNTIVLDYGTDEALAEIEKRSEEIAAILVEPVQSADPDFQPREFLHKLRALTERCGIALVMDEVISGFRAAPGGAQEYFKVQADMATYGKILGGGLPIGALAGKRKYMDALDGGTWKYEDSSSPEADMTFFAGTFVRHPLAMTAAYEILKQVQNAGPALQKNLSLRTEQMARSLNDFFRYEGFPIRLARFSSLFRFMFPADLEYADMLYFHLLDRGIFTRGWGDNCFLSTTHSDHDIKRIIEAVKESCLELRESGFFPDKSSDALAATSPSNSNNFIPSNLDAQPSQTHPSIDSEVIEKKKCLYALTDAQKEIWLSSLMGDMASCAYNEPFFVRFHGPLNLATLQRSLDHVLSRHEALRLRFDTIEPLQYIDKESPIYDLKFHDWSTCSEPQRNQQANHLMTELATTPFDLAHGPLVRLHFAQETADHSILYISAHHIICDGWSWNLMLKELGETYSAWLTEKEPHLPFCGSFLNEFVKSDTQQDEKESLLYWRKVFEQLPEPLELPTDSIRPPTKVYAGATISREFDPTVVKRLKRFASERQVSLFSLAFTAFNLFLRRLSGQRDIVVTVPTAGQSSLDNSHVVGHCVNLLPVRSQIRDEQTFAQLLQDTASLLLDAYDHQHCTLGSIVREIRVPRDPSRMPLVEVNFNLDRDSKGVHFEGLSVEIAQTEKSAVNFEIFFNLNEHVNGLRLDLDYNRVIFRRETWIHWLACFEHLLRLIPDQADIPISQLDILPEPIRNSLITGCTGPISDVVAGATVVDLIEKQVEKTPRAIAISYKDKHLTYEELNYLANQIARELQQLGVEANQLVGVFLPRSELLPATLLAIQKLGAAYIPLDPEFPTQRLQLMVDDAQPRCLVTVESLQSSLPRSNAQQLRLDSKLGKIRSHDKSNLSIAIATSQRAYILYTSGSSGRPKGVEIPHRALTNFLKSMQRQPGISSADRLAAITTLSFDISILEIYLPLISGAEVVVVPNDIAKDGSALAKLLNQRQITFLQATPATWQMLLDSGWKGSRNLRGLVGGEALPSHLGQNLSLVLKDLWNMYGPTETTVWSILAKVEPNAGTVSIGRAIENTSTYILDDQLRIMPAGTIGKLFIGGQGLAQGYLNLPDLTREKFISNPYQPASLLYDTGDLVRLGIDGQLYYVARVDHQIKLRGFRIELGEIEQAIRDCAGVREAIVVVKNANSSAQLPAEWNKSLVAYYVAETGAVAEETLRNSLQSRLPAYMVPNWFIELKEIPRTPNLKADRKQLAEMPLENSTPANRTIQHPRNAIEKELVSIWKDVLNLDSLGINDSFFDLGGHSLLAARLMARIEKVTGKRIPLASLLQFPTIEGLGQVIRNQDGQEQWKCVVPIRDGEHLRPLFCIHAAGGNVLLYRELANRLQAARPVYGVQSSALQHGLPKSTSVEEMAREYVAEIRKLQPRGPYHFVGYCLGGTIAYEIARQLSESGEEIGVLALLDTHAKWQKDTFRDSLIRSYQRIAFHLQNAWMSGRAGIGSFVSEKIREASRRLHRRWEALSSQIAYRVGWRKTEPIFLLENLYDSASEEYLPKPLKVHLTLFKPKQSYAGYSDTFFGWQNYVQDITLIELPVYPAGMLIEPFVAHLASHIERQLSLAEDGLVPASDTSLSNVVL